MINIGVLGGSEFAEKKFIPNILELSDSFNLIGIASRSTKKAEILSKRFKTQGFSGYNQLLFFEGLQAMYVPLPNSLHFEWIKKCLDQGLHVIAEKSLGCTLEEVKILCSLAEKKKLALLENFHFRFHHQFETIKNILNSGEIGELRSLRSSFGFPPFPEKSNIRYSKKLGGGALLDAGAYPIKIAQEFLGTDVNVKAAKSYIDEELEVDLWGGGFIEQKNGNLFAEFSFGFDNYYQCSLELWGSKGKIYTDRIFTAPPDYCPKIRIESSKGKREIKLTPDNAIRNTLRYFHGLTLNEDSRLLETSGNLNQARLISEFSKYSLFHN